MALKSNRCFHVLFTGTFVALFIGYFTNISSIISYNNRINNFDFYDWKVDETKSSGITKHNGTFDENPEWFQDKIARAEVGLPGVGENITTIKKILYWNPGFAGQIK